MRELAMWRVIATLVVGLALVLVAIGVVFFVGMRTGSPLVRDVVRRFNRAFGNSHQMEDSRDAGRICLRHPTRRPDLGPILRNTGGGLRDRRWVRIALPYGRVPIGSRTCLRAGPPPSSMKETRTGSTSRSSFPQPWPRPICRPRSNGAFAVSPSTSASGFAAWSRKRHHRSGLPALFGHRDMLRADGAIHRARAFEPGVIR